MRDPRKERSRVREMLARRQPRTFCILRDAVAAVLAAALAFLPIAAVHSLAEAHPLGESGSAQELTPPESSSAAADADAGEDATDASATGTDIGSPALPSSYFLTNAGLATSVKLQNPWGACWAFAIASAIESSILKAQADEDGSRQQKEEAAVQDTPQLSNLDDSVDVSERAIAWLAHELQTEGSAGAQAGEGLYRVDEGDYTTQLAGGNFSIVEAALAARQSLVPESAAPYQYNGYEPGAAPWYSTYQTGADARARDWSVDDSLRTSDELGWYVDGIVELPSPAVIEYDAAGIPVYVGYDADATRDIKETLMQVGAVAIALEAETSLPGQLRQSDHFDYGTWSQYDSTSEVFTNHAVSIVGWDDNYSKESFGGTVSGQPPADGAWLCKNNWGSDALYTQLGGAADSMEWGLPSDAGASGLFWLSYYDHTISTPVAFEVARTDQAADSLYQYDYLGMSEYTEPASYEGTVKVANVFTAETTELLRSVTAQTFRPDEKVECKVYLLPMEEEPEASEGDGAAADDGIAASGSNESAGTNGSADADTTQEDAEARPVMVSEQVDVEGADRGPTGTGTLAAEAEQEFAQAGFHTIDLDRPVLVAAGQRFCIVQRAQAKVESNGKLIDASYLNLELAFADAPEDGLGVETLAQVVSNPGETYVALGDDADGSDPWMTLEAFNTWYQDVRQQSGSTDVTYGNALIKALTDDTSMASEDRIYRLVRL